MKGAISSFAKGSQTGRYTWVWWRWWLTAHNSVSHCFVATRTSPSFRPKISSSKGFANCRIVLNWAPDWRLEEGFPRWSHNQRLAIDAFYGNVRVYSACDCQGYFGKCRVCNFDFSYIFLMRSSTDALMFSGFRCVMALWKLWILSLGLFCVASFIKRGVGSIQMLSVMDRLETALCILNDRHSNAYKSLVLP